MIGVVALISLPRFFPLETLESRVLDYHIRSAPAEKQDQKVVLILASNKSMSDISAWPWPRDIWATLISERINSAKTIALDVLFSSETQTGQDDKLAQAMEAHGNVILAAHMGEELRRSRYPIKPLFDASAGVGYINIQPDRDGNARRFTLAAHGLDKNELLPSFPYAAYIANGGQAYIEPAGDEYALVQGDRSVPLDGSLSMGKLYVPSENYEIYEFSDVYNGNVPPEAFDGALCFVGVSATGAEGTIMTPGGSMFGTRYLADSYVSIVEGRNPQRSAAFTDFLLCLGLGLACFALCRKLPVRTNWLIPVGFGFAWFFAAYALYLYGGVYVSSVPQILAIAAGYILSAVAQLIQAKSEISIQSLSTDVLLSFTETSLDTDAPLQYADYIHFMKDELMQIAGMEIVHAQIHESALAYKGDRVFYKDKTNKKYCINLPLPTEKKDGKQCTVLAAGRRLPVQVVRSICAWIISAYIYVKTINDTREKQKLFYDIIRCMAAAIDAKDPVTSGHSQRVSDFSAQIGEWLGLDREAVDDLRFAGIVHDIVKIGVPDSVLNKPGKLTEEEYGLMKLHPAKGHEIMGNVTLSPDILSAILRHHERMDGGGYPERMPGKELPLSARIVKIADVYDALVSNRQYKEAWPIEKVCRILYEGRGTEFDEEIVMTVLEKIRPAGWSYDAEKE